MNDNQKRDKNELEKFVSLLEKNFKSLALIVISFMITPNLFYVLWFGASGLSNETGNWGAFGDFVGGLLNPLLSAANLVAVLYIAIKIYILETTREKELLDQEQTFQQRMLMREEEMQRQKSEKEEKYQIMSVSPLCQLLMKTNYRAVSIVLQNVGIGPAKIKSITAKRDKERDEEYKPHRLDTFFSTNIPEGILIYTGRAKYLAAGDSIKLIGVSIKDEGDKKERIDQLREAEQFEYIAHATDTINRLALRLDYSDLYDNEMEPEIFQ